MNSILIVDDNTGLREQMKWAFCNDYTVFEAGSAMNTCLVLNSIIWYRSLDMGLDNIPDKGLELMMPC